MKCLECKYCVLCEECGGYVCKAHPPIYSGLNVTEKRCSWVWPRVDPESLECGDSKKE